MWKAINKESPVPLYYQLKEIIKEKIKNDEFQPGDRIPTELELCQKFGISRITVRQALSELVAEGLLYKVQGSGTFVNDYSYLNVKTLKAIVPEEWWVPPLKQAEEVYNKDSPGRRIKLRISVVGRPQLEFKIITAVAKGEAPDLALVDWAWLAELVEMHFLEPLDELDRGWAKEYRADLFQAFNNEPSKLYGAQIEANVSLIWYRKDWFDHEGIKPPESWGELVEVARHFKIKRRKYGLSHFPLAFVGGLKAGETTTYQLLPFIWSAGGEVLSEGEVVLDNKAIQAVEFLRDLVHRYKVVSPKVVSYEWNQLPKLFATGEVALAVGGSYEKAQIQEIAGWDDQEFKGKVGFIPIPARPGEGGRQVTLAGGMVYTIFSQSKNPKAAMEILKIVTSSELMRRFCQVTGRNPTRVSVAKNLDPQKDWFTHETSKLLCKARLRPSIPQYAKVSEQLQMMFENAISGRLGPDEAVRKAKEIIEALI